MDFLDEFCERVGIVDSALRGESVFYRKRSADPMENAGIPAELLEYLNAQNRFPEAILIGVDGSDYRQPTRIDLIVDHLEASLPQLGKLRSLFLGITGYIKNDVDPLELGSLLESLPGLEHLGLTGCVSHDRQGFSMEKPVRHISLNSLWVETDYELDGFLANLSRCVFTNLESLHLRKGSLKESSFLIEAPPFSLKCLSYRNGEHSDDVAKRLVNSRLMHQLEVLDLSEGWFSNDGVDYLVQAISDSPSLKQLRLEGHFASTEKVSQLDGKSFQLIQSPAKAENGDEDELEYTRDRVRMNRLFRRIRPRVEGDYHVATIECFPHLEPSVLNEIAVEGTVRFCHLNMIFGRDYRGEIVENPTWMDIAIEANNWIVGSDDYHHVFCTGISASLSDDEPGVKEGFFSFES